jgi:hypothetical protein
VALAATIDCLGGYCPGTKENDTMNGTGTRDEMNGLAGGDLMYGLGRTDFLYGQYGDGTLVGGDGDDEINALDEEEFTGGEDFVDCGKGHAVVIFDKEFDKVRNCEERIRTDR